MKRNIYLIYLVLFISIITVCTRYGFLTEDQWNELYGKKISPNEEISPKLIDSDDINLNLAMTNENSYNNISYIANSGELRYARSYDNGKNWNRIAVTSETYIAFQAIAARGSTICISYVNSYNELKLAVSKDNGNNWQITPVLAFASSAENSITLDDSYAYISYSLDSAYDLYCMIFDLTAMSIYSNMFVVDGSDYEFGRFNSIDLDNSNIIYIAYRGIGYYLCLAKFSGGSWLINAIDEPAPFLPIPMDISLYISGTDLHISYFNQSYSNLNYFHSSNSGLLWDNTVVESSGDTGWNSKVAIYGSDRYISYFDRDNLRFKLAVYKSSTGNFTIEEIDLNTISEECYTSLSVDQKYIYYFYNKNRDLYFTRRVR